MKLLRLRGEVGAAEHLLRGLLADAGEAAVVADASDGDYVRSRSQSQDCLEVLI